MDICWIWAEARRGKQIVCRTCWGLIVCLNAVCVGLVQTRTRKVLCWTESLVSLLSSGSHPCIGEAPQSEEQAGKQTRKHWFEEDSNGNSFRGLGTGAGGRILNRMKKMMVDNWGERWRWRCRWAMAGRENRASQHYHSERRGVSQKMSSCDLVC